MIEVDLEKICQDKQYQRSEMQRLFGITNSRLAAQLWNGYVGLQKESTSGAKLHDLALLLNNSFLTKEVAQEEHISERTLYYILKQCGVPRFLNCIYKSKDNESPIFLYLVPKSDKKAFLGYIREGINFIVEDAKKYAENHARKFDAIHPTKIHAIWRRPNKYKLSIELLDKFFSQRYSMTYHEYAKRLAQGEKIKLEPKKGYDPGNKSQQDVADVAVGRRERIVLKLSSHPSKENKEDEGKKVKVTTVAQVKPTVTLDVLVLKNVGTYGEFSLTADVVRVYNNAYGVNIKGDFDDKAYFSRQLKAALDAYTKKQPLPTEGNYTVRYSPLQFTIEGRVVNRLKIINED